MPRAQPIEITEKSICQRIREARLASGLTQVELARRIGVDSTYLAAIEHGRNPLRYRVGYQILNALRIHPTWLLTGVGQMKGFTVLPPPEQMPGGENDLFTEMYAKIFTFVPNHAASLAMKEQARAILLERIDTWLRAIPGDQVDKLVRAITQSGEGSADPANIAKSKQWMSEMRRRLSEHPPAAKTELQYNAKALISPEVKRSPLELLMQRVSSAASEHGKKSELAQWLDVPQQRVYEWLRGERSPGGDTTLRLLQWVTMEEAKQNTPASASNTREGEPTHKRKHSNETPTGQPKSEPPRKKAAPHQKQ